MPLRWTKGSPAEFISMGERIENQLYRSLAGAMAQIASQAAMVARQRTDRVDTGAMINAITSDVRTEAKTIIGRFGFLDQQAEYFLYQTVTGFTHWLSGEFIEPTFALRDAKILAEGEVVEAIERAIRSVKL